MSNTFVIGDIHGGLKALQQVINRANVTANDKLIFLGDYVDGWSETPAVLDFLIDLSATYSCVFMQGNHEEMLIKWLKKEDDNELWRFHGGEATVQAYQNIPLKTIEKHISLLEKLNEY